MKNFKIRKLMALLLCTAMLLSFTLPLSAAEAMQTFAGTIISESEVDLSGIGVKIYSAEPVYDEAGELQYYAETYDRTVYTNSIGVFSFTKPTTYCSYTIDVATLPAGYGISKHTQFIVPTRLDDTVTAAPIATAETSLDGDNITVTFADASGNVLYTDYEVVPDTAATSNTGNMQNITATEAVMTYSALKTLDSYTYSGTVVTNGKKFRYSEEYDLSDYSEIGKADFLYSKGIISEDEKYGFYIEYLNDDNHELLQCATFLLHDLESYYKSEKLVDTNLKSRIQNYLNNTKTLNDELLKSFDVKIITTNETFCFRFFYPEDIVISENKETLIKTYSQNVYNLLVVNNGFESPTMSVVGNETFFPVYIVLDSDLPGATGATSYFDDSKTSMKITIKETVATSLNEGKSTFAHEFMHAITNEYTDENTDLSDIPFWFNESNSVLAGLIFSGCSTDATNQYIKAYKANCDKSIFSTDPGKNFQYGTVLYLLYIYTELGGWNTIETILSNYKICKNPYIAISNVAWISSYSNAFAGMAGYNYNTNQFYFGYFGASWGDVKQTQRSLSGSIPNPVTVNPMATRYEVYSSGEHNATLSLSISCDSIDGLIFKKACVNTSGRITLSTEVPTTTKITILEPTFGDSTCDKFVLIPINSIYTGTSINYTITANLL